MPNKSHVPSAPSSDVMIKRCERGVQGPEGGGAGEKGATVSVSVSVYILHFMTERLLGTFLILLLQ